MSLQPGTTLGPYQVTAKIGEGGMGEVWQARDTKLDRDVALKVLPEAFTSDPDRLARFEREAKVLASLNHPNIGSIYGLEESDGVKALVLELVEGPTLADRIKQGPIPIDEALPIAKQIAEALEAAHEQGVIHRDLKPANVKVKSDGTVKVLDFGLAKAFQPDASDPNMSMSPTISLTAAATQMGMVIGTAAYMAPEQASGKTVDKRADVWAFGVVLYEMLTGTRPFVGDDVSKTLAHVIATDPDWSTLPKGLPPVLGTFLRGCLEKNPKQRVQAIGDVRLAMEGAFETTVRAASDPVDAPQLQVWQRPISATVAAIGLLVLGGLAVWGLTPADPRLIVRMPIPLGAEERLSNTGRHAVAISPDGSHIVYSANGGLSLRPVDQLQATPLAGTSDSDGVGVPGARNPFFSPDGLWIGFHVGRQLKKISISGGAPVTLCEADQPFGASWGPDDTILFGQQDGIWQVPATSGAPERLIALEEGELAHGPHMLPGGEWVLFTFRPAGIGSWDDAQIVMQSLETEERVVLILGGRDARYVETGHLVYALNSVLFAVPFDLGASEVTRGPVPLVEGIRVATGGRTGAAHFSLARNGSLVYVPGEEREGVSLVWVTRTGEETPTAAPARPYRDIRVSPDGTRVASDVADANPDVWIWHLDQGPLTRLTFHEAADRFPLWTPDSSRVVFSSGRDGGGLFWKAADGTGEVEALLESPNRKRPWGWSADGRLLFDDQAGDIGVLTVEGDRTVEMLLETEFEETTPALSPDGRWLAYQSNESGEEQIYVQPFPNIDDGKWQVSTNGGVDPVWSPDGRQMFFFELPIRLMVAEVETDPTFNPGTPIVAFDGSAYEGGGGARGYDIAPDGERFLMRRAIGTQTVGEDAFTGLIFVENWFEELKARVPVN